jgi:formylglycine-generating enzyme required for sulfatase activity
MKTHRVSVLLLWALGIAQLLCPELAVAQKERLADVQTELKWLNVEAVRLAFEDMKTMPGFQAEVFSQTLEELEYLSTTGFSGIETGNEESIRKAERAITLKKQILLANPLLDKDKIVATRFILGDKAREAMAPDLGTQANNWSNQESAPRRGFDASIIELSGLQHDKLQIRTLFHAPDSTSIADLKLHWNAGRMMFTSLMPDSRWNLFEIPVEGSDDACPMIRMEEPDLEFYDGTWLPDGRIIANSNIGYQGVPCVSGEDPVGNMVLYNPEDGSLRRLTFDQDANWNPVIMNNGRVMYTRWEYTDLTHYYSRIVMHINPDGTENKALFGSGSMFPNSTFDLRPLPNHPSAFAAIISGHHGIARSGRLLLFDPAKGRKGAAGVIQEIPYRNRPVVEEVKDELVNGVWPQFIKPSPLNEKYFLVAAKPDSTALWGIYLVDIFDNVTCLYEAEGEGFISPIAVRVTPMPPVIPDRVKLHEKEATVFIQDIYEGEGLRGVPRGTIKSLRLFAYEYAYVKTVSDHNWHGIQTGWDIKRLLGTVPIEEDGSVIFTLPANTPTSIQPVDADGCAVQWMRSWFTAQPGEFVSCVGCHEDQNHLPPLKRVMASKKKPVRPTLPEGGIRPFTFDLEVQPVLDRACIACHNGEGRAFDLRGYKKDSFGYGTAYLKLHPYVHRQGPEADMPVLQPYEYHANTSELIRLLKKGHHNVQLTPKEWQVLYTWIDLNAPDKGYFNADTLTCFPYQGFPQIDRRIELTNKYGNGMGVNWKKEIADYAEYLRMQGTTTAVRPVPSPPSKAKKVQIKGWPFETAPTEGQAMELAISPSVKMIFKRIPAGEFIMGSDYGENDAQPLRVKIERPFWMAEVETTNEQYAQFCPEHDSRYVDQLWKDHTRPGYVANEPQQPVIRVSYEDALRFCRLLSEQLGRKATLPTEAQWEWACRAGNDKDFWFGDLHTDFSAYENLADASTTDFAVNGIDPQPMKKTYRWYPYYSYLPKVANVNDGFLIQTDSKSLQPNPYGLYSMHGNIAEWTTPHPSRRLSEGTAFGDAIARGGSYIDRPKYATAHTRRPYYPWQRVFNVGFRVIIED